MRIGKILENSTDYSIQNTIRPTLFLPTTREAKYKAKTAIDTFFTRVGDLGYAGLVYAGTTLGAGLSAFAWLNVGFTILWLFVAGQIESRASPEDGVGAPSQRHAPSAAPRARLRARRPGRRRLRRIDHRPQLRADLRRQDPFEVLDGERSQRHVSSSAGRGNSPGAAPAGARSRAA